jgi:hypothetical protein
MQRAGRQAGLLSSEKTVMAGLDPAIHAFSS